MINLLDDELFSCVEVRFTDGSVINVLPMMLGAVNKYHAMIMKLGDPKKIKTKVDNAKYEDGLLKILATWLSNNQEHINISPEFLRNTCTARHLAKLLEGFSNEVQATEKK